MWKIDHRKKKATLREAFSLVFGRGGAGRQSGFAVVMEQFRQQSA